MGFTCGETVEDGYREVIGAAKGMKEDKVSWISFFQWLRDRGLDSIKLIVGEQMLGYAGSC
jgi:putative transposase